MEAADEKYEDFAEVVGELTPTTPWAIALMEADNGHDIAYYLGQHMDEAKAIAQMSPLGQVRAIGRLEAKLAATPPKAVTPSKAPAPITPLKGTEDAANASAEPKDDNYKDWLRWRQRQVHKR